MARFSRALTAALTNPTYSQGLFNVGQLAGAAPTNRRAVQEQIRQDNVLGGMMSTAGQGNALDPALIESIVTQAGAAGVDPTAALTALNVRREAAEKQQAQDQNTRGRAQLYKAARSVGLPEDVARLALSESIAPKDFVSTYMRPQSPNTKALQGAQFDNHQIIQDSEGNYFDKVTVSNPNKGSSEVQIIPWSGSPENPVGQYSIVNKGSGETPSQRQTRETDTAETKVNSSNFSKIKTEALSAIPAGRESLANAKKAYELAKSIPTGGPYRTAGTAFQNFLGTLSGDKAELQYLLGREMYRQLKPLFGGVISEGERQALEEINAGIKRGNVANEALIGQMIKEAENALRANIRIAESNSFDEWNTTVLNPQPVKRYNPDTGQIEVIQ